MNERWTGAWVGFGALMLALGSWLVSPADADDEDAGVAPTVLLRSAFLTGEEAPLSAELEGVAITVQRVEGAYELVLENTGERERALSWQIECSEVRGSMLSRIGPIPVLVHEELAALRVPARGRAVHRIELASPSAPSPGGFATMRILLRPAAGGEVARQAVLSVPAAT